MADRSKIEWCDATWNPITGCTPVSAGCDHCYARRLAGRFWKHHPAPFSQILLHYSRMDQPLRWRRPRRVLVGSMGDLFHEDVPLDRVGEVLRSCRATPRHTFMFLTKRAERMRQCLLAWDCSGEINGRIDCTHMWFGVTAENQSCADHRVPILRDSPAALRFISCEPLLEAVTLNLDGIGWVIAGPETGPGARPCSKAWIAALWGQCVAAGVPFFLKRLPRGLPPEATPPQDFPAIAPPAGGPA
jgi:protein gp37